MKLSEMQGNFYECWFAPNKLAYINKVERGRINFLVFMKEKGQDKMKAVQHYVPSSNKSDFKEIKHCFNPSGEVWDMIREFES